jgi:hypothetical protein
MKYDFLIILIALSGYFCPCKYSDKNNTEKQNDRIQTLTLSDSAIAEAARLSPLDYYIKTFADSINNINDPSNFREFLKDPQFDYNQRGIWSPSHHALPLRFMIFSKVNNCNVLKMIIHSSNSYYKQKLVKVEHIDDEHIQLSSLDIASKRYTELQCRP